MTDSISWENYKTFIHEALCPPGEGVFTVHTAKERKEKLHASLYGSPEKAKDQWSENLDNLKSNKKPLILGICSDTGGGILRGANWGPLFLRLELLKHDPTISSWTEELGDVRVIPHLLHDKYLNPETIRNCRKALYKDEESSYPVGPLTLAEDAARGFYQSFPGRGLFGIGGDHSCSYPLVRAFLQEKKKQGIKAGILHFDAHTDLLVERLGIDLCFGSWVTHILADLESPGLVHQFGIRSSGKPKEHWEKTFGVNQFWAHEVQQRGAQEVAKEAIEHFQKEGVEELYVSFDIDALDASFASATGTPETGGLNPQESLLILQEFAKVFPISGADMMEIAPFLSTEEGGEEGRALTLEVGASISHFLLSELKNYSEK